MVAGIIVCVVLACAAALLMERFPCAHRVKRLYVAKGGHRWWWVCYDCGRKVER